MKRKLAILMIAAMSVCMAACGNANEDASTEHDHDHDHDHAVEVKLRIGVSAHDGDVEYESAERFAQLVHAQSDGAIVATVYGDSELGSDQALLESMEKGEDVVDIVVADLEDLTVYAPMIDISTLPYLFNDYDDVREFMNDNIQAQAASDLGQHNMRALAYYSNGFSCVLTAEKMINNAHEMQGMTLATIDDQGMGSLAMKAVGARTMEMGSSEFSQATRQGVCDGCEGNIVRLRQEHYYQDMNYIVMTHHTHDASGFVIADSLWTELDPSYQEIIQEAATASADDNLDLMNQYESQMLSNMESAGARLMYTESDSFWNKAQSVIESYSSKYGNLAEQVIHWGTESRTE